MTIQWDYPPPRQGWLGEWDKFIGPGATRAEMWLAVGFALAFGAGLVLYAAANKLGWNVAQYVVGAALAMDIAGGVVTNATAAAKRWYHRPEQGNRQHITFIAVHAAQLFLVAWLFRGMDWNYFLSAYGYLLLASFAVIKTPLYLQRPMAMLTVCGGFFLNSYAFSPTLGFEWFLPFFFLKLLVSHLLREEPYAANK